MQIILQRYFLKMIEEFRLLPRSEKQMAWPIEILQTIMRLTRIDALFQLNVSLTKNLEIQNYKSLEIVT